MGRKMLLQPTDIQVARSYYTNRDKLASSSARAPRPGPGKRKTGRTEWTRAHARQSLIKSGEFAEYDLRVVSLRTVLDRDRTLAMETSELRLWDKCAACHKELGPAVYRFYLDKRIEHFEMKACMACSGSSSREEDSFVALRRAVAILVQERIMLDMENAALKAAGFDGAFIALGRSVRMKGFREETGWYTEGELRAHRAAKDAAKESEGLPTGDAT